MDAFMRQGDPQDRQGEGAAAAIEHAVDTHARGRRAEVAAAQAAAHAQGVAAPDHNEGEQLLLLSCLKLIETKEYLQSPLPIAREFKIGACGEKRRRGRRAKFYALLPIEGKVRLTLSSVG